MKMVLTTWIAAPVERVFHQVSDVQNLSQRIPAITRIEMMTPGPVAVGTRFRETRTMFGRDATEEFTVVALEPERTFTLKTLSCGVEYEANHTFAGEKGGTNLTLTLNARPVTWFAWILTPFSWLMQGMMKKLLQKDLSELKAYCERQPQAA